MNDLWGSVTINCGCCLLPQRQRDRDGALPVICDICHWHQGERLETRLARAETHEQMLRQRLDACRAGEQRARTALDRSRGAVASALFARGWLAAKIVKVAEEAGRHRCSAVDIGRAPEIVELAEKHWERNRR